MQEAVAILSDIHGNAQALRAVLDDLTTLGIRERVCLGDVVGYGGSPGECVDLVRANGFRCVQGNHDFMVGANIGCEWGAEVIQQSNAWTRGVLSSDQLAWLASLPLHFKASSGHAMVCIEGKSGMFCGGGLHTILQWLRKPS